MNSRSFFFAPIVIFLFCYPAQGQWVRFNNESATRLSAVPANGTNDVDEKDYAWGDVDKDGDIDLVSVRKEPFTSAGKRTNVLYMNEGGVLTDRTSLYATEADVVGDMGFLTPTNDRDVLLVDVNLDTWLDIVTATTISDGDPKHIGHPRIYINKTESGGVWQGFRFENSRIPTMTSLTGGSFNPRFCSVAAGDLTGDGAPELWFGDYDSSGAGGVSEPAGADFDDRLLINNGNGFFTDETPTRFSGTITVGGTPYPFRRSAFGAAAAIVDMNNDGKLDIVKQTSLNPPQYIGIAYNKLATPGFFDTYQSVYTSAPYFVTPADLNNDNRMDLIVTDDATDRYLLNNGNNVQGLATFSTFTFPAATGGFGSQSVAADLDRDNWKDVLISDVDVDIGPCGSRQGDILRNNGNAPSVTFVADPGDIPSNMLVGVHNFAVFDINGDNWLDLVIGRCNTTEVWINVPPTGVLFTYPEGLPSNVPPGMISTFQVQATGVEGTIFDEESVAVFYRINGGAWSSQRLTALGPPGLYEAVLPSAPCPQRIDYYFSADAVGGGAFTGPPGAPGSHHSAVAAIGLESTVEDFESGAGGWTVLNENGITLGIWERADPNGTLNSTAPAAPEDDAQAGTDKVYCFVSDDGPVGGAAGANDVDGGPTHLISPLIDLTDSDAIISYARWVYSSTGGASTPDSLIVSVSNNDGANWTQVEAFTTDSANWQTNSFQVGDFFPGQPLSANVRVRFSIQDTPNNSVTEAAIDVVEISKYVCASPCACPADLNGDQQRSGLDIQEFLACFLGGGSNCACGNLDGTVGMQDADIPLFVDTLLVGDECPP
ncbi:MAG TPA: VCBS repeat-containing protein [Phycisphaerae bacterium]|nr:VCBS repeat-containing protein [Phycisphaerae bacterium]